MTFQVVKGVERPLAAASEIAANGNRVVLEDEDGSSYIRNKATGFKVPVALANGINVFEVALPREPFRRLA